MRIIQTKNSRAVEWDFVDELREAVAHIIHAVVILHVLAVNIRHNRNRRRQHQERTVAFVSLHDYQIALTNSSVRAERLNYAANNNRRIKVCVT